jgi:signal transduction histidine kinase/CheY-like chemotaxis protein/PAS domain-containing protein
MSDGDRIFLTIYALKSVVIIPMFLEDNFWGLFSIEDCRQERTFSNVEIHILTSIGLMTSNAVNRNMQAAKMREADERMQIMFDATPLGANFFSMDGSIIDCNKEMVRLFDMPNKQEYLERFSELSPEYQPDGRVSAEKGPEMAKIAFEKGYCRFEWLHQKLNGEPIPCEVTFIRIKYKDDFIVVGYVHDLRELKAMLNEIHRENEKSQAMAHWYESILNAIPLPISVTDADTKWTFINTEIEKYLDITLKDAIGKPCSNWGANICNTEDCGIACAKRGQKQAYFSQGDSSYQVDTAVLKDLDEKTMGYVEVVHDITNLKLMAKKQADTEAAKHILENILNGIDAQIYVTVPHTGEILFVNNYMKNHFKIEGDCIGKFCYKLFLKDMDGICDFCPCYQLDKEPNSTVAWEMRNPITNRVYHNTDRYIEWIDGTMVHLQQSVDVTELIDAKEMAEAGSRAKSEFLAKMSHEMRTPMNAVIGMAEIALREKELDAARRHVFTIKQAGSNLLAIINDILDLSKVESGKLEIVSDYYPFSSLANDVISIIRMRAMDSQLRFAANIDSNIPNELYGDETRVRQILINILGNAVKYTQEGFVSFTVTGEFVDEETINLSIEVTDTGRGIKREDIGKLFSEYSQVDAARNKGIEGVGLGLAIARRLLEMMGGEINVNSEYGKGSVFTVRLPQKFRSGEKLATVEEPSGKSVIVFEQREIYARSVAGTVENLGVSCDTASDGAEFREKIAGKAYTFIFIAPRLYMENKGSIAERSPLSKTVLLAEFGEAVPDAGLSILAMPAYSIPIADALNGSADVYSYRGSDGLSAAFTAPEARVLVVDDIRTNLTVAEGLLLPYGMRVDLCKSGAEAINAALAGRYDLILMDHWMPEMDGIEAAKRIRDLGYEDGYYRSVPIIALTANAISGVQNMFLENGFNGFLAKPIDTAKLDAVLGKWIPRRKQRVAARSAGRIAGGAPASPVPEIEGVDVKKGLALAGGSAERYMRTLEVFYEDGLEKTEELGRSLAAGDIALYTIHAHALKSAAANIGAEGLSGAAREMETAGRRGDLGFIEARGAEFLESMGSLLKNISGILPGRVSGNAGQVSGNGAGEGEFKDAEALESKLAVLKEALAVLDVGVINSAVDELMGLPADISAAVRGISRKILVSEFDEALALAENLLRAL